MMVAMDTTTEVRAYVQLQQGNICNSHEERITTDRTASLRNKNNANVTAGQGGPNDQNDHADQQHPMDTTVTAAVAPPARAFRKTPFSMSLDQQEISGNIGSSQPFSLNVPLIEIEEFVETTIVLKKDKKNELGISIVGGSDTYLETICVSAVHPDGTAFKDGRLKRGDILLAVNDRSLRDVTSSEALVVMREACSPVRLVVLRENPLLMFTTSDEPTKYVTVELRKVAVTDRLGLSIMHGEFGQGVFVTWVRPGSIAARQGRILQGDRVLEINGQNVRESSQRELASTIQNLDGAIVILLGRVPSLTHSIQEWTRMKVGSPGRIRTSTWSYTAKEKLQSQRPSLPVSTATGKENNELLIPVPIPFPIPPPHTSSKRFGSLSSDAGSPHRGSGIVHSMRRTLGPEGANLPLVLPLKIDEELLCVELRSPLREKRLIKCPKIEVTNC